MAAAAATNIQTVRNIGVIAHIDAGKTTTTERMLYYSGYTKHIGNVDEGDTVMDYLPAERNRGITITSAAITFDWNNHRVNLIDTPGHADFTFEVIRAIRVLDGAVTVLDGVEGVEAQTETVWRQAAEMGIPRIVFVNKMDREGAGFGRAVREIVGKLQARACIINMPLYKTKIVDGMTTAVFCGIIDVIGMKSIEWIPGTDGREFVVLELEGENLDEARKARVALVETLAEIDDTMVEKFLELDDDHLAITPADINGALRRCTLRNQIVPVLCGASFRNIGVQPLLDAIVNYLPSPADRPQAMLQPLAAENKKALLARNTKCGCALAFKVIHDNRTGKILVFVRVYAGVLTTFAKLWNNSNKTEERALKLSRMYADESVDIEEIPEGHIGVISGTKEVRTGDTLLFATGTTSLAAARAPLAGMQLLPIAVPQPVFFASIEPKTVSDARPLEQGLETLLREDPSLHVTIDKETGQTQLSGMGELHLEIASDRLVNDLKVNAYVGAIQIAYKESLEARYDGIATPVTKVYSKATMAKSSPVTATVTLAVRAVTKDALAELEAETAAAADAVASTSSKGSKSNTRTPAIEIPPPPPILDLGESNTLVFPDGFTMPYTTYPHIQPQELLSALISGATAGLFRGTRYGLQIHALQLVLSSFALDPPDAPSASVLAPALRFAVADAFAQVPQQAKVLMEPIMQVTITVAEEDIGGVMSDLSSARAGRVYALEDEAAATTTSGNDGVGLDANAIYTPPDATAHLGKHNVRHARSKRLIKAMVPLREMVGYLKHLRSITQGRGTFTMSFERYERVSRERAEEIWSSL
ncbi:P-loop containing nucleoside triphosphate hydrolase protein [Limtongia smithiae]|uniref:P-loop containing nucleoside triphosphate hydrolase protein n=1 Tax=Limtongia smithiae TaxID=1125753 RepID=UPI0034CD792C